MRWRSSRPGAYVAVPAPADPVEGRWDDLDGPEPTTGRRSIPPEPSPGATLPPALEDEPRLVTLVPPGAPGSARPGFEGIGDASRRWSSPLPDAASDGLGGSIAGEWEPGDDALAALELLAQERPWSRGSGAVGPVEPAAADWAETAIDLACEAVASAARCGVFLRLREGRFEAVSGRGDGLRPAAVRPLWFPATAPSVFREALRGRGSVAEQVWGRRSADRLVARILGSREGRLLLAPVHRQGLVLGLLLADGPAPERAARRLAQVVDALERALNNTL